MSRPWPFFDALSIIVPRQPSSRFRVLLKRGSARARLTSLCLFFFSFFLLPLSIDRVDRDRASYVTQAAVRHARISPLFSFPVFLFLSQFLPRGFTEDSARRNRTNQQQQQQQEQQRACAQRKKSVPKNRERFSRRSFDFPFVLFLSNRVSL